MQYNYLQMKFNVWRPSAYRLFCGQQCEHYCIVMSTAKITYYVAAQATNTIMTLRNLTVITTYSHIMINVGCTCFI